MLTSPHDCKDAAHRARFTTTDEQVAAWQRQYQHYPEPPADPPISEMTEQQLRNLLFGVASDISSNLHSRQTPERVAKLSALHERAQALSLELVKFDGATA